jgi:hypothetical protein
MGSFSRAQPLTTISPRPAPQKPTSPHPQEEEARLKAGTLKAYAFAALKEAGAAGLGSAAVLEKVKEAAGPEKEWPKSLPNMLVGVSARARARGGRAPRGWAAVCGGVARGPQPPPFLKPARQPTQKPTVKPTPFQDLARGIPASHPPAPQRPNPQPASQVLGGDAAFCRVARGVYALRALPGVVPMPEAPKPAGGGSGGGGGGEGGSGKGEGEAAGMSRAGSAEGLADQVGAPGAGAGCT